jgi:hypothetical protein
MMSICDELNDLNAPRKVKEAGEEVQKYLDAKLSPPRNLVLFIQDWVGRNQHQNRYGK